MPYTTILLRIVVSVVLSGIIGLERQQKSRPAGFRTHILVALGATTIILLAENMFIHYYYKYGITFDPTRMAAQVVSGIGFLGAGTIIHYGRNVKGLTTAASLWAVAAIGLAVGAGYYAIAATVTAIILITLFVFHFITRKIEENYHIFEIVVSIIDKPKAIGGLNLFMSHERIRILETEYLAPETDHAAHPTETDNSKQIIKIKFVIKMADKGAINKFISDLSTRTGVSGVELI
jgi:putative Mg2+ transporter-C (MgtC) family protein